MQRKTIIKVITRKLTAWLATISDENLRRDVRENILVSGGSITSLFQGLPVNDYDVYIKDMDVLIRLANYYCPSHVMDGRDREMLLLRHYIKKYGTELEARSAIKLYLDNDLSEETVRIKNLKTDQVKLNISSVGLKYSVQRDENSESPKFQVAFLSQNAISLTDDLQIVLRFHGDNEQIHKTFDFIHATNYFTFKEGLVTNLAAVECILSKTLKYQGSLYPLTTIIRIKKFLNRGWSINAGEMLKVMFQISELDLKDPIVLEEQLIGVDIAYFAALINELRNRSAGIMISSEYLNDLIDKIFNEYDGDETES